MARKDTPPSERGGETYRRLIHSARWLRLRRDQLTRQPLCERCKAAGLVTAATEVHHSAPVQTGRTPWEQASLLFDPHNLVSLCHACHQSAHRDMGKNSRAEAARRNKERADDFRRRFLDGSQAGQGDGAAEQRPLMQYGKKQMNDTQTQGSRKPGTPTPTGDRGGGVF